MITGNKGEWSEIYVFLKLLADGKLHAADAQLNAITNTFYPVIKILRKEVVGKNEYIISNKNIDIVDGQTGSTFSIPIKSFIAASNSLLTDIKNSTGRSFSVAATETFLQTIKVYSLSASSQDKADIRIVVHDMKTGQKPELGFSIKSMLGKDATLFNAGAGTNFIYKITPPIGVTLNETQINTSTLALTKNTKNSKIAERLKELQKLGCNIKFEAIQSSTLQLNLTLIDSMLPEIMAFLVFSKYLTGKSKLKELLQEIEVTNPLNFDMTLGHPFYEYKVKNFLTENALGMTPEKVWKGKHDATGGLIIVKETGDVVCYHVYNHNEFQDYLLNHTKLEQPTTSEDDNNPGHPKDKAKPFKYGWIYKENNDFFIKLNLQIRFI